MKAADFFKETREEIEFYAQQVLKRLNLTNATESNSAEKTPEIQWPSVEAVAAVGEVGDWYFITSAQAYISVLEVLERNAGHLVSFLVKGMADKQNKDWAVIRDNIAKVDARRFVPLIFHPYLNVERKRYFLRANDSCQRLASIVDNAITRFSNDVQLPGLMNTIINKYGSGLRKSQAALKNRLMRYAHNQSVSEVIEESEAEQRDIKAGYKETFDKLCDPQTRDDVTAEEISAVLTNSETALNALDISRPAQIAQYLRDDTKSEVSRLNQLGAYHRYTELMQDFLKHKYPKLVDNDSCGPDMAVFAFEDECDARNAFVLKAAINQLAEPVAAIKDHKLLTDKPKLKKQYTGVHTLINEKTAAVNASEKGALNQVKEWVAEFSSELNDLLKYLEKYKAFNARGIHMFSTKNEVTCSSLAKDAYFHLRAYQMLNSAAVTGSVYFARYDLQKANTSAIKKVIDDMLPAFSDNKGDAFDAAVALKTFSEKAYLFDLEAYRTHTAQGSPVLTMN